jgi:hypothetical protein
MLAAAGLNAGIFIGAQNKLLLAKRLSMRGLKNSRFLGFFDFGDFFG